jgi:hypothetical protein
VGERSVRTKEVAPGVLVDFGAGGEPIGLEITTPSAVAVEEVNVALKKLGLPPISSEEIAPFKAA